MQISLKVNKKQRWRPRRKWGFYEVKIEVGGLLALDEAEAQTLLQEVYSLSLLDILMGFQPFSFSVSILHLYFCVSLLGAEHAKEVKCFEGGGQSTGGGGTTFRNCRVREGWSGSGRFRGRFLWASEGSYSTLLHILSPTSLRKLATFHPPVSPIYPLRSLHVLHLKSPSLQQKL